MGKGRMINQKIKLTVCYFLIIAFVAIFGYQLGAWTGFPKGVDVYARVTRIVYLLDFFPHISWQYHWSNGMPTFKTEAPLFYFLGALMAKVFSLPPEKPLAIIGFFTFVFIGVGLFGYVFSLTRSLTAGLLAAVLAVSSFSVWDWMIYGGVYPRIFGFSLSVISFWFIARFLQTLKETSSFPRWTFFGVVVVLAATMSAHILMGFFACIFIFFNLVFFPLPWRKKVKYGLLIYLTSFCLSGFFLLPLILSFGGESFHFLGLSQPLEPTRLFFLFNFDGMGPFVLPLLGISLILILWRLKSVSVRERLSLRLAFAPFLMFLYFSIYALIGYTGLPGKYYYIGGFIPFSATLFMTLYGGILIGLIFGWFGESKKIMAKINLVLISLIVLLTFLVGIPHLWQNVYRTNVVDTGPENKEDWINIARQTLKFPPDGDFQYRFAPAGAFEAIWFNVFHQIPQERDYYGQGVLYPDWRYWFEQVIWNQEEFSLDEAKTAFDWFATRWFSVHEFDDRLFLYDTYGPQYGLSPQEFLTKSTNRYLKEKDFKLIAYSRFQESGLLEQFEIENPSPILSATNSFPVLFIGDKEGFNLVFRSLSLTNLNSQKLIPVLGKQFIDEYQLVELKPFETIFLYNYRYRQKGKAYKLLQDYVSQGGNLIWEVTGSPDFEGELPEPAPASQVSQKEVKEKWNFRVTEGMLTSGINFSLFSPLIYNDGFWKISVATTTALRPWAKGVIGKGEEWVALTGNYGEGKIIWTGFNFPYHLSANKSQEEAKFLVKMVNWLGREKAEIVDYQAEFVNPERRVVEIKEPARGVLFKESYYPNWHAFLVEGDGKKKNLKVMLAGPAMMYSLLPEEMKLPAKVVFEYRLSLIEKLGFGISVLTLLLLPTFLFLGKLPITNSFLKTISNWWDKEEK